LPRKPQPGWHGQSVDNANEDGHDRTPRGLVLVDYLVAICGWFANRPGCNFSSYFLSASIR
jgi:hypothetical protein